MRRKLSASAAPRIGIIGGGQLGQMMALAGVPLGMRCQFLDTTGDVPAARVGVVLQGALDDARKIETLARDSDVLTFDWENVPSAALTRLRGIVPVRPSVRALAVSQDRLAEKALFERLRIPVTPHACVDSLSDLQRAVARLGCHGILKTRRLGYDGKGQRLLEDVDDVQSAWAALHGSPLIYEQFVPFAYEVSLIAARSVRGETAFYPLARNVHRGGILRYTIAPWTDPKLERSARRHLKRLLDALAYVGVLAVEFFVSRGELIANEMAPRVHNSGHWTIEGCVTSQFENHLRAICNWPLGSTRAVGHAAMVNFIGTMPPRRRLLDIPELHVHDYGKTARPGRKVGHGTLVLPTATKRDHAIKTVLTLSR